jgi:HlyD family secretion protein
MKRARALVPLFLIAVLVGTGTWLVRTGRLGKKPEAPNLVTLYGNVDIRQVELGFRVAGRLTTMHFEEGEAVTAGALMTELDLRPFEDQLRASEARAAVDEALLKKAVSGSRPAEIARGRAAVNEARAAQQNALVDLERTDKLVADGAVPQANHDTSLALSREADARLASAEESLRLLLQGSRDEDIAAARATLRLSQASVAAAQTSLDDAHLVAPSDGIVTSRVREPGAIVSPSDVVYVLSLTHSVWVRAYVSEVELGRLHPGMAVEVLSDAARGRVFKGHVGFISPTAEFTPKSVETPELRTDLVYRIRVVVDDADPGLRQGMPVTARVRTGGA